MANLVISGNKRMYKIVDLSTKKEFFASPRKTLLVQKGPIYIGDFVEIGQDGTIVSFQERKNLLIRPRVVNLDLAIVVCSTIRPDYSSYLLEKFLTYLDFCNIPTLIAFSKVDLLNKTQKEYIISQANYYQSKGYLTYLTSKEDMASYSKIKEIISNKTVAFMGQTGAGKSTLINAIDPNFNRAIGEYSTSLGRGKHQTKEVILLPFENGYIGDTPGFSSLDLKMIGLKDTDLYKYFPGFNTSFTKCFFKDCSHTHEKECQVKKDVSNNLIQKESYDNYVKLLKEIREGKSCPKI